MFFPWDVYVTLSNQAHLQKLSLSPKEIKAIVANLSKFPLVVSAAFLKLFVMLFVLLLLFLTLKPYGVLLVAKAMTLCFTL